MKLLVTGREGQLVRSLIERGAGRQGLEIVALGRPELDLARPASLGKVVRAVAPDVIVSAAAYTAVDKAEEEKEQARLVNAEAPAALAAAARATGARIIQVSTDYVFDGSGIGPYAETAPVNPLGAYGRTKLAGEGGVRRETPDHVIVRTAWVYSSFGRNFLKTMMTLAETRDEVNVVADQRGNPSSALDIADGLLAILDRWKEGESTGLGETYHLAGTGEASWADFAALIFEQCRMLGLPSAQVRPISSDEWPTPARRPANSTLDSSKFSLDFNYRMPEWRHSARETVRRLAGASPRS